MFTYWRHFLFNFPERDLYLYVAYCDLLDNVIAPSSQESFISREDVNSFNLLQDDSYLGSFEEIGLSTVFFEYPAGSDFLIEYYRSQIESIEWVIWITTYMSFDRLSITSIQLSQE